MGVDVLVVAALPEELAAARAAAGVAWEERDGCLRASYRTTGGRQLSVALARPTHMGGRVTGATAATLVDRLRPSMVAMCGVCAGNPDDTALGDVVVAEPVYGYDEGKWTPAGFTGDHRQIPLDPALVRAAQNLDPTRLPSHGTAGPGETTMWLLERLHLGEDPRSHPARARYFPAGTWGPGLDRYEADGLITRAPDGSVALADAGRTLVRRRLYDDVDGPQRLPFRVFVAPMGSGSAVVADARIWPSLAAMGMRRITAIEMEGATIATVAHQAKKPWLVVKGVMDHAGPRKDDRYKAFAARASAEVLFALLDAAPQPPRVTTGGFPVDVRNARGVQIGDHNTQTNTFHGG